MCLHVLDKERKHYSGIGYKVATVSSDGIIQPAVFMRTGLKFEVGKMQEDTLEGVIELGRRHVRGKLLPQKFYPTGFHIFTSKKDARAWAQGRPYFHVYKVKYSKVVATGQQNFTRNSSGTGFGFSSIACVANVVVVRRVTFLEEISK